MTPNEYLRQARSAGYHLGAALQRAGRLPVEHTAPCPGIEMSRRRRAAMEAFDRALLAGYLDAHHAPGETNGAAA